MIYNTFQYSIRVNNKIAVYYNPSIFYPSQSDHHKISTFISPIPTIILPPPLFVFKLSSTNLFSSLSIVPQTKVPILSFPLRPKFKKRPFPRIKSYTLLIFDQMNCRRQTTDSSQRTYPNSDHRIRILSAHTYNPEFEQLSAKKMTLPSNSRHKILTPTTDTVRETLLNALTQYFETKFGDFDRICRKWIAGQWREIRLNLQSRLSKINYLNPTLVFESFAAVQKQVKVEWRKNNLLKGLTYLWTFSFLNHTFANKQEVAMFYRGFAHTFTQLTITIFSVCMNAMEVKGVDVYGKLLNNTAVAVVTELKQWRKIYENKLEPFLLEQCTPFSENFDIKSIEMDARIVDVRQPLHNFQKTKNCLVSLTNSLNLDDATEHLSNFRDCLLKQIGESIELQGNRKCGKQPTVEKDDILGCIMYVLVTHKLDNIGCFLAYLSFLLGEDIDVVLRERKVDCFRADLEAAYWFVSQPVVKLDYSILPQ